MSLTDFSYDFDANIEYKDDDNNWRVALAVLFKAGPFDDDFMDRVDALFELIKTDTCFNTIRDTVKQTHFIGDLALLSFDFLILFHRCLQIWKHTPNEWNAEHDEYKSLLTACSTR